MTLIEAQTLYRSTGYVKLCNTSGLPFKTLYELSKIASEISAAVRFYESKYQALVAEYADKDDKGKPVTMIKDGKGYFNITDPEAMAKCLSRKRDLDSVDADIDITPVKLTEEQIDTIGLTVEEFNQIQSIISVE